MKSFKKSKILISLFALMMVGLFTIGSAYSADYKNYMTEPYTFDNGDKGFIEQINGTDADNSDFNRILNFGATATSLTLSTVKSKGAVSTTSGIFTAAEGATGWADNEWLRIVNGSTMASWWSNVEATGVIGIMAPQGTYAAWWDEYRPVQCYMDAARNIVSKEALTAAHHLFLLANSPIKTLTAAGLTIDSVASNAAEVMGASAASTAQVATTGAAPVWNPHVVMFTLTAATNTTDSAAAGTLAAGALTDYGGNANAVDATIDDSADIIVASAASTPILPTYQMLRAGKSKVVFSVTSTPANALEDMPVGFDTYKAHLFLDAFTASDTTYSTDYHLRASTSGKFKWIAPHIVAWELDQGFVMTKYVSGAEDTNYKVKVFIKPDGTGYAFKSTYTGTTLDQAIVDAKAATATYLGACSLRGIGGGTSDLSFWLEAATLIGIGGSTAAVAEDTANIVFAANQSGSYFTAAQFEDADKDGYIDGLYFFSNSGALIDTGGAAWAAADFHIWVDTDSDGKIEPKEIITSNGADVGPIAYNGCVITGVAVADKQTTITGNDAFKLTITDGKVKSGAALRARLLPTAKLNGLNNLSDSGLYDPWNGSYELDIAKFGNYTNLTAEADDAKWYDANGDGTIENQPNAIKVTAVADFGAAVADKAPAGIETLELVANQPANKLSALVYVKFTESVTIGDFDGAVDAKNTKANELFKLWDTSAGAQQAFTGNLYRLKTGKLNDLKTNGVVVGTNVESSVSASAGTEFILEMSFISAFTIATGADTLFVDTWQGKILDAASNSTTDTITTTTIGAAGAAPSKPAVSRVVYTKDALFVDVIFTTNVQAVNRNTDVSASAITELNDAFKVYDGAGESYSPALVVSQPAANTLRLTWSTADALPVGTGLTVKYDPALTNNETDEYAVIGYATDAKEDYQITSSFTASAVETSYTAKTADLNFDGYVDALIIDLGTGQKLDTTVTPAAAGFSIATTEWKDYNNTGEDVIIKAGQTLNPSSVEVKNHYDNTGKVDESFLVLKFDYAATTPFDWNPSVAGVQKPKTDANGFGTISYSGTDVKTAGGASIPAFYISAIGDGAAPAILSGVGSATNIALDMSEALPATLYSGAADNDDVSGFFVFKDANGYVMDTTEWDFAAATALSGTVGSESNYKINIVTTAANVKAVKYVYVSQEYASVTAAANYTNEPIDDGTPNVAGKSVFNEDKGTTAEWQTYDSYTKVGTLVEISKVVYPTITAAQAFWNADGYYDQVLVCLSETVTVKNPLETANGAGNLENSWFISLDTDDTEDDNKEIHKLKVDKAELLTGGKKILLTISQGRQESSASGNDVHPVKVYYVDNSVKGTATVEYLVDTDVNYMRSGSASISLGANQRVADPRSVEVSGTLKNFDNYQGATITAYEFYKYTSISENAEVEINFEYGPLAKLTKGAFGIQANGATDQCHQEGVYTGLKIVQDSINGNNYTQLDTTTWGTLVDYINKGYGYIHTDYNADGKFDLVLSDDPDSKSGSVNPGGANVATSKVPTDSVFKVTINMDKNGNIKITGPYGITGKGKYTKAASEQWYRYNAGSTTIAALATDAAAAAVGSTFIPLNATTANYKVVAQDKVGAVIDAVQNPTNAQKVILSRIGERKVVLTFKDCCSGSVILLNGLTADVDINYYFYNYDGPVVFDPDRLAIFDYKQVQTAWNLLPIVVDKFYYTAAKAPGTNAVYPGSSKTQRNSAKIKVDAANTALIGLSGGLPVVAAPNTMIFGLDKGGLVWAQAKAVQMLKGGYAYAIQEGTAAGQFDVDSIYVFGYNVFTEQTAGVINMAGGQKLLANVIDVTDSKDARSEGKLSNLGWNLMADVADIDLATADNVDYVITFDNGVFDSWIDGGSLNDFTVITNDYNKRFSFSTSDEDVATGYKRGVGYFVHTEK